MALSKLRGARVRYEVLRSFVVDDMGLTKTTSPSNYDALDALFALAEIVDKLKLANVPRHSVIVHRLCIAIEDDEIVNITRHNDAHVYAEPTLEILK